MTAPAPGVLVQMQTRETQLQSLRNKEKRKPSTIQQNKNIKLHSKTTPNVPLAQKEFRRT